MEGAWKATGPTTRDGCADRGDGRGGLRPVGVRGRVYQQPRSGGYALDDDNPAGGCRGKAPNSQGVASGRHATPSSIVAGGVVTRLPAATSPPEEALKFAGCMRSHGITDFPDPSSGGGFVFHASAGMTQSPQFQAAQKACQRYMPPGPGSGRPPPQRRWRTW